MIIENLMIDCLQNFLLSSQARDESEVSGKSEINNERTRLGVHAGGEHNIDKVLFLFQMLPIIYDTVVNDLSNKADWGLGSEYIQIRHVEIIHEVDELLAWWWTEISSSSLVNLRLNNNLKGLGVSVGVEID